MQDWQSTYLGMRELPLDISDFERQAFFTFSPAERALIDARRGDAHKLSPALHIRLFACSSRGLQRSDDPRLMRGWDLLPTMVKFYSFSRTAAEPTRDLNCSCVSEPVRTAAQNAGSWEA